MGKICLYCSTKKDLAAFDKEEGIYLCKRHVGEMTTRLGRKPTSFDIVDTVPIMRYLWEQMLSSKRHKDFFDSPGKLKNGVTYDDMEKLFLNLCKRKEKLIPVSSIGIGGKTREQVSFIVELLQKVVALDDPYYSNLDLEKGRHIEVIYNPLKND